MDTMDWLHIALQNATEVNELPSLVYPNVDHAFVVMCKSLVMRRDRCAISRGEERPCPQKSLLKLSIVAALPRIFVRLDRPWESDRPS